MSKSAFSLRVFSIYLFALGLLLLFVPNLLLSLFGIAETREVWIRVTGMLVLVIGFFDFMASRNELFIFFRWTVFARLGVLLFFAAFVALGLAPPVLILFGLVDAAAAIWTAFCLRADNLARQNLPADS